MIWDDLMPMHLNQAAYALFLCSYLLFPRAAMPGQVQPEMAPPTKSDSYAITEDGREN